MESTLERGNDLVAMSLFDGARSLHGEVMNRWGCTRVLKVELAKRTLDL